MESSISALIIGVLLSSLCQLSYERTVRSTKVTEKVEILLGSTKVITHDFGNPVAGKGDIVALLGVDRSPRLAYRTVDQFTMIANDNLKNNNIEINIDGNVAKVTFINVARKINGMGVKFSVYGENGMGNEESSQSYSFSIVDPPKVTISPNEELIKRSNNTNGDIVIECSATGEPQPDISWYRKSAVGESTKIGEKTDDAKSYAVLSDRKSVLTVKSPILASDNGTYECQAKSNSELLKKEGKDTATKSVSLQVSYKPEIKVSKSTIYTDIGKQVEIQITVSGSPEPEFTCELLKLPQAKTIRVTPTSTHLVYDVTILKVKESDIGSFTCKAKNSESTATQTIKISMTPSKPLIKPTGEKYSDYYLLSFSVQSGAPMSNATLQIFEKREEGEPVWVRNDTFKLDPNQRSFGQHIVNLTEETQYELRLQACNTRGCSKESNASTFRTLKYDGTNKVDPLVLKAPVTDAPRTGNIKGPGGMASSITPLSWAVMLTCFFHLFNH